MTLNQERSKLTPVPVPDFLFQTLEGEVSLLDLIGGWERLLAIHNMGQGCRYCALWADRLQWIAPAS